MKSILAVLASMMTVAALAGQSSHDPESNRGIVAVGCVNRAAPTGSLAAAPGVPPATPVTAGALANAAEEPTNALVLNGATPPDATEETRTLVAAGRPPTTGLTTYVLDGARQDLEKHAGHRVEVRGDLARRPGGRCARNEDRGQTHRCGIDPNAGRRVPRGGAGSREIILQSHDSFRTPTSRRTVAGMTRAAC